MKLQKLGKQSKRKINYTNLGNEWRLLNIKDSKNIATLEKIGKPLKKICKIHSGLATLNNDVQSYNGDVYVHNDIDYLIQGNRSTGI